MKLNNGLRDLQINVPHAHYGECKYFMPKDMALWLSELGLRYSLSSQSSWGTGRDDNGVSTWESHYSVRDCRPEDASAFKIQFPQCTIHVFDQYSYD